MKTHKPLKKLRRKKQHKDFLKKKHQIKSQMAEIRNGHRKGFSVEVPKKRKS